MAHQVSPRALETMRTYHNQVRALHPHLERLFKSWRLLMSAHHNFTFSSAQQAYITQKIYGQLKSWGISAYKDDVSSHIDSPQNARIVNADSTMLNTSKSEWVIRCWLDFNGELEMTKSPLNFDYVGCLRSVASVQLPLNQYLPQNAKHDQRHEWNTLAQQLDVDELLLCDAMGMVLESHNSNFWLLECHAQLDELLFKRRLLNRDPQALRDTYWVTPPLDGSCLPGITRSMLVQLFEDAGAQVYFERVDLKIPQKYHEKHESTVEDVTHDYYLSSTLKSFSPISSIDHCVLQRPVWDQELCAWVDDQLSTHHLWGHLKR